MTAKPRPACVVITRSREGNEELARKLRLVGMDPIAIDTISIVPPSDWRDVDRALRDLKSFDWIVFTSSSGVEYFRKRTKVLSLKLPWEGKPRVAAVGERTAAALARLGVETDFVPSSFTSATLGEELPSSKGKKVLLLRSDAANPALEAKLLDRGFKVEKAAIYRTLPLSGDASRARGADFIVFASPSAVKSFCSAVTEEELRRLRKLKAVCIGPVTETAAKENGFADTVTPQSFTTDAVVEEIRRLSR